MKVVSVVVLFLGITAAIAQTESKCLCLLDVEENLRYSCERQRQGFRDVIHCRDDDDTPYRIETTRGWTTLADGEGFCNPCRRATADPDGQIRGNGDALTGSDETQTAAETVAAEDKDTKGGSEETPPTSVELTSDGQGNAQ